ncbi:MAG: DHH family phosphoesterase [Acidobacteriota bacterium]
MPTISNLSSNIFPSSRLLADHEEAVKAISDALLASRHVLVTAHEHPDGDALGSTLALYHALRAQGKEVVAFNPDRPPAFFSFLPSIHAFTHTKTAIASCDTLVILDSTHLYRTQLEEEALAHPLTLVIDHHQDNSRQGKHNLVVPEAASTTQILFELFQHLGWPMSKDVATCLLTGLFTDTGSFMHDSVTPRILEIAAYLMQKGARLSHIAHETYQKKDLAGLRIWGRALSRIMTNEKTGSVVSIITYKDLEECGATRDDLDGVVNMLNTLPDSKFALLLTEHQPGKIKGSLRSEPHKGVDVSKIAKMLGGGGHKLASGFDVKGHIVRHNNQWRIRPVSDTQPSL